MICSKLQVHCGWGQLLLARAGSTLLPAVSVSIDRLQYTGNALDDDPGFFVVCDILGDPTNSSVQSLHSALDKSGFKPYPVAITSLFLRFHASPKLLCSLFDWSLTKPDFNLTPSLLNCVINALGRTGDFSRAWCLILECLSTSDPGNSGLVSFDTFACLVRRYSHEGFPSAAIRTYYYASKSGFFGDPSSELTLYSVLLDALCKTHNVKEASSLFKERRSSEPLWAPSTRIYNTLLHGWLRVKNLKQAEKLWSEMKSKDLMSFSTMIEGYCKLGNIDKAIELFFSMHSYSLAPDSIIFKTLINALADERRVKEASGMMERLMLTDFEPDTPTFNALVKGYCKAGDLEGANKVLKTMINANIYPTTTTYNYIFNCYAKLKRVQEAMELYWKLLECGYVADRKTYRELIWMMSEDGNVGEAMRVCKEMRERGVKWERETGAVMIHLLCSKGRHAEAFHLFEEILGAGVVPQKHTFRRLNDELRANRMIVMAKKMDALMASVPGSCQLLEDDRLKRKSVLQRAQAMSEVLKTGNFCRNPHKNGHPHVNYHRLACRLIEHFKTRACQLP